MQRRAIVSILVILILLISVGTVNATESITIPYDKWNLTQGTKTYYNLTESLSPDWYTTIDFHLTFNVTTSAAHASILLPTNDSDGITFQVYRDNSAYNIYYTPEGETQGIKIYSGTYTLNDDGYDWKVVVRQATLTIYAYNSTSGAYDAVVENFALTGWTLTKVGALSAGADMVTAGYVTITVAKAPQDMTGIINAFIPVIVTFAMLSAALGMIKKAAS